jgi:hypothetical protein
MWQTVEVPFMHYVRSLRVQFGRCSESSYKQMGLRRLRTAANLEKTNHGEAMNLIREADQFLLTAQAHDDREAYRASFRK